MAPWNVIVPVTDRLDCALLAGEDITHENIIANINSTRQLLITTSTLMSVILNDRGFQAEQWK
ncbi:hypothetical protein ymoll0001_26710 [Yersinia mollaretii ATCC 43969]|uniref:Uncharacterized protein n=1 Tax=Yersinia mollaretii (strain ATCC 43969 / DSM 18520 / CIP 103324 / CNY 7263 / WAIP 204) TaxID=349967 RepID=A0ABM9YBP1_YERMW|nr:hypothetical protein ymoll0001_26710 [Yersinia mollaretii ATCC 43969]PJE88968.1 hypothetical protein CU280_04775 [Yersinia mollaretii]